MWQPLRGAVFLHLVALTMVGSGPAVARARDAAPPADASGLGLWIALQDERFCFLDAASWPGDDRLQINVHPITNGQSVPSNGTVVTRRWHRFVITWR
jgi:hypothetical protein